MSLLQNLTHTVYFQVSSLKTAHTGLNVSYGLPDTPPQTLTAAIEHDKTKVDEPHELAGYRKRSRVFLVDVYAQTQADRNNLVEEIKDMFENKALPVVDAQNKETGIVMDCDGVRVEVDLTQRYKARVKIYVYTLVN